MIWILAIVTTIGLGTLSDASASSFTMDGNRLVSLMREYEKAERSDSRAEFGSAGRYMGYVLGVADTHLYIETICTPQNVTARQFGAVVA